jgi:hypothetical protein
MLDGLYDTDGKAKPVYVTDDMVDTMTEARANWLKLAQKAGCALILRTDRNRDMLCRMLDNCAMHGLFFFTIESAEGD